MIEEHSYWALVYSRWVDEPGWSVVSEMFFGEIPGFIRSLIQNKEQKKMIAALNGQGLGRHNREEIYSIASKNITALSNYLGDKKYFFGKDKLTSIDICLHSYIINIIIPDIDNPHKDAVMACQNLVDHALRLDSEIYGDLYKKTQSKAA